MGWDISDEDFCPLEEPDLTLNVAEDPVEGELDLLWDVAIEGGLAVELPGYNVYKSETDGSNYQPTATPSINCYSDGEVTTGVIYFYKVTALDSEGNESQPSNEANGLAP
jgi:fibronectin type 3 domain-containing protein